MTRALGIDVDASGARAAIIDAARAFVAFGVAIPAWGMGTGGARFACFSFSMNWSTHKFAVRMVSPRLHARSVAQCDRPDRELGAIGHRIAARLRTSAHGQSRGALGRASSNDALGALLELKRSFSADVSPILAMA